MEMRRQVTVSWDSGGSDEAPPKVRLHCLTVLLRHFSLIIFLCSSTRVCYGWLKKKKQPVFLSACSPVDQVTPVLVPAKASSPARNSTTSRYSKHTPRIHTNKHTHTENKHKHTTARVRKLCSCVPFHPPWLQQCFTLTFERLEVAAAALCSCWQRLLLLLLIILLWLLILIHSYRNSLLPVADLQYQEWIANYYLRKNIYWSSIFIGCVCELDSSCAVQTMHKAVLLFFSTNTLHDISWQWRRETPRGCNVKQKAKSFIVCVFFFFFHLPVIVNYEK